MPLALLVLLLVPVLDVVLLFVAASYVGGLPVLGFVVASAVLGGWLARRAGSRLASGLFTWPGPMTTFAGIVLLLPPVRRSLAAASSRWVERRVVGVMTAVPPQAQARPRGGRIIDIDIDVDG